jgi:hypothetical protein
MSKTSKTVSLNDLPDEILLKIFCLVLEDKRTLTNLRGTCERFAQLINRNLLNRPDCPSYVTKRGSCVQCFRIFNLSRYKRAKCNCFVMNCPLRWCCLNTFEALKQNLETITEFRLTGAYFDLITLSSLLNIMKNVHRLRIDCRVSMKLSGTIESAKPSKPFNRTLSYLEVDCADLLSNTAAESILLNFHSRDLRLLYPSDERKTWFQTYLLKHQKVVKYFEIIHKQYWYNVDPGYRNFLRSLHFQVHYTLGLENGECIGKIEGFKLKR